MAKKVVGVYEDQTELIEAIEEFKNKGYSAQDFSVIGDTTELSHNFESRTGIATESKTLEEKGFWQNIVSPFEGDNNLGGNEPSLADRLVGFGLTDEAAEEYEEDVRNGRLLLLAEANGSSYTEAGNAGAPHSGDAVNERPIAEANISASDFVKKRNPIEDTNEEKDFRN